VGAATRFRTATPIEATLPPRAVFGFSVSLSITASRYVWNFGDGESLDVPATEANRNVTHTYRVGGAKTVTLRTFYTATFTISGDPTVNALDGTADVPGIPTTLAAREARTQLEAGQPG